MLCPGGIVCIVLSTTRLLLKVAWTLSLNWALSTVSGMNHQHCLTGRDQKMMSKQNTFHIQDILFNISCCLCSILGLFFQEPFDIFEQFFPNFVWDHLASFWRHFLNTRHFFLRCDVEATHLPGPGPPRWSCRGRAPSPRPCRPPSPDPSTRSPRVSLSARFVNL